MTSLTIRCSPRVDTTSIRKTLLSPTSPLSSFTHSRSPREPSTKTSEPRTTLRQQAPADVKPSSPPADIDPSLPVADRLVLRTLLQDIDKTEARRNRTNIRYGETTSDEQTLRQLAALSDTTTKQFEPSAYASWKNSDFHPWINKYLLQPYTVWATTVVRHPKDVPYLTAMLTFLTLGLPNFVSLFRSFNWYQGIFQWVWVSYHVAPYTMLMHWHHHSRFLSRSWSRVDQLFPYLLSPMMGWTWNSFHYHHKQHHIEDNGPDDISSTLRYQRDSAFDFFMYVARFIFLCWLELPLYYARKNKLRMACKVFAWEITSYAFLFGMAKLNFRAAMMAMILPLIQWRIVIMASNWGHHGFIDEVEPSAPIRCSTNYVDVMNEGYHTMHHLNPTRHWSDHPYAFVKAKKMLAEGQTLTFRNTDSISLAFCLLREDYDHIVSCLVPMGDQIVKSKEELAAMLRRKAMKFTEEDIRLKFG